MPPRIIWRLVTGYRTEKIIFRVSLVIFLVGMVFERSATRSRCWQTALLTQQASLSPPTSTYWNWGDVCARLEDWQEMPVPKWTQILSGKRKQHKHKTFWPGFPADIPAPYARMPRGQKVFSPPPAPQENALFGADVHDFWRGRPWPEGLLKIFVQKKFALTTWVLFSPHLPGEILRAAVVNFSQFFPRFQSVFSEFLSILVSFSQF